MKQKLVLSLDSHAISSFQRCREEHRLAYIKHLETAQAKSFYDNGTLVHLLLGLYYRLRRRGFSVSHASMLVATKRFKRFVNTLTIKPEDEMKILSRFFEYIAYYKDEMHQAVGIEVGFSEVIFEDRNFLFIYEGRVDWIGLSYIQSLGKVLHFEDHKTRSQNYELDMFKNQFYGYSWMMRKVYGQNYDFWGSVNYFGMQEDKTQKLMKDGKLFERVWFQFTEDQIKQWEKDTIWWFHQIAQARMFNIFPRSWQCDRQFGECSFKRYCKQPTEETKNLILSNPAYYKKREKAWSAWE